MPIFVSDKAYLAHEWLYPGYDLLQKEFGYKRDYLLPLATPDLQGCIQRRAEYSDAAGYSRALMLKLRPGPPRRGPPDSGHCGFLDRPLRKGGAWTAGTRP